MKLATEMIEARFSRDDPNKLPHALVIDVVTGHILRKATEEEQRRYDAEGSFPIDESEEALCPPK